MTSSFCRELLVRHSVRIRRLNWLHQYLTLADGFRHSLLEWRNKSKIKRKSTIEILASEQMKENSTENSAEKNFKEDSQFNAL